MKIEIQKIKSEDMERGVPLLSSGLYWSGKGAIKEIALKDEKHKQEIYTRASLLASIDSPYVIQPDKIYEIDGDSSPKSFIMIKHGSEGDLLNLLESKQSRPLHWPQRYRLATDIALGLADMHKAGILHPNLESRNVLFYDEGDELGAKIFDFNAVALHRADKESKKIISTLWSDPAVLRGERSHDEAADIYSLGMIFWELASHTYPFSDIEDQKTAENLVLKGEKPPIPKHWPEDFAKLIRECWDSDPKKRPTASAAAKHLQTIQSAALEQKPKLVRLNSENSKTLNLMIDHGDLSFQKQLGAGTAGEVHKGEYKEQKVAIKTIKKGFSKEPKEMKEIVKDEASVMFSANSDHLVKLHGICVKDSNYHLVMEYMDGGELTNVLEESKPLPWSQRYQLGLDIALGLSHLHDMDILHRDLKISNVLLYQQDNELRAKIADLGLATLKENAKSDKQMGTMIWMAPELNLSEDTPNSKETDIYSLGLILWSLASYPTSKIIDYGPELAKGNPPPIPQDCPPAFKALIEECFSESPDDRPDAFQISERLRLILSQEKQVVVDSVVIPESPTDMSEPVSPSPEPASPLLVAATPVKLSKFGFLAELRLKTSENTVFTAPTL